MISKNNINEVEPSNNTPFNSEFVSSKKLSSKSQNKLNLNNKPENSEMLIELQDITVKKDNKSNSSELNNSLVSTINKEEEASKILLLIFRALYG